MKWIFSHDTNNKILIVNTEGTLDLLSANKIREEGAELIKQHGYLRCLLDHSKVEHFEIGIFDTYELPRRYEEMNIPHNLRMAVVVSEHRRKNSSFYETVCRNNGYLVSIFFDKESALNWLKSS